MSQEHLIRAVLDTNVLVAAFRSNRGASFEVYRLLKLGFWRCLLSNHLLLEYEEQLIAQAGALGLLPAEVDELLNMVCDRGEQFSLRYDWLPVLATDPDDEPLVQLAHESGSRLIVTHNIRHLAPAKKLGITVLRPSEFLAKIRLSL